MSCLAIKFYHKINTHKTSRGETGSKWELIKGKGGQEGCHATEFSQRANEKKIPKPEETLERGGTRALDL